jgi:hypothetical protein
MVAARAWPSNYFTSASFDLSRYVARNELYGGITQVREMAEPRWVGGFTTAPLTPAEVREWRAWWDGLRGGLYPFLAYDPLQALPVAYSTLPTTKAGGGAFTGVGEVTGLTATTIAMNNLPANFIMTIGDMVELREGDLRGLFRIMASVTGSSGGVATVTVEPRVSTSLFSADAQVNFDRPACAMIPNAGSWSYRAEGREMTSISFAGTQVLY